MLIIKHWLNKELGKISQKMSLVMRRPIIWGYPRHISLEVTSFCNLQCPLCKLGKKQMERDSGMMDFDKYCRLIDEISPFVENISFPWYGEPFTRKDLGRFVRYASEKGMAIDIQTNGTFLHRCEIDYLVECNIHNLIVAIDGLEQKTYEIYRVGGNLSEIVEGVKRVISLRQESKRRFPEKIQMHYIVMHHNEHELDQVEAFGKEIGFDRVKIKSPHVDRTETGRKFLPSNPKFCRYEDDMSLKSKRNEISGCSDLWRSSVITWDGTMGLCCFDSECEYSPGNVFEDTFSSVWFGKRMQEYRRLVLVEKNNIPLCKNCHKV